MNAAFSFFMFITLVLSGIVLTKENIIGMLIKDETQKSISTQKNKI